MPPMIAEARCSKQHKAFVGGAISMVASHMIIAGLIPIAPVSS